MSGIKVRATRMGQHGGIIRNVDEVFRYNGTLDENGDLPSWVEALEDFKKEVKAPSPKKKASTKEDKNSLSTLM